MPIPRGAYRALGAASLALFAAAAIAGFLQALTREGRPPPVPVLPRAAIRDLLERNDYEQAARELEAMTRMNPGEADLQALLGYVLGRLERPEEAVVRYGQALAARPDDVMVRARLVAELARLRRFDEGLPHLRELVRRLPRDPDLRNAFGYALERAGEPTLALAEYERALELSRDHPAAAFNAERVRLALAQEAAGAPAAP